MPTFRALPFLALALGPLAAQVPISLDDPAFGGSRVFSEGLNPLGNPARFDLNRPLTTTKPGYYGIYVDGGQEALDFKKHLERLSGDFNRAAEGLQGLANSPWGLRTRSYGLVFLADNGHLSFSRQETTSLWSSTDLLPVHLGSEAALAANGTTVQSRRTRVERIAFGMAGQEGGHVMGLTARVERWSLGSLAYGMPTLLGGASLRTPGIDFYAFKESPLKTTTATIDIGYLFEMSPGVRLGLTGDRLVAKRLWDVDEKPQFRAGLQMDLGTTTQFSVEADLNEAMRMPYPIKQRALSASLTLQANPSVSLVLGAERRKYGQASVTRGGATLRMNLSGLSLGIGFQIGQETPLKAAQLALQ